MKLKSITYGAISIVIVIISFHIFRGTINIFNSIIIPLAIYVYFNLFNLNESISFTITLLIIILIFFIQQLVFIILYILISLMLLALSKYRVNKYLKTTFLSFGLAFGFYLSIYFTDNFIGTNILNSLLTIVNNNYFALFLLFLIEGLFIGVILVYLTNLLDNRLYFLKQ